jgi:hypothetical protein
LNQGLRVDGEQDVEASTHLHPEELGRRHPGNRHRDALDGGRRPDDAGRSAKTPLPEFITDHRHRAIADHIVSHRDGPAQQRTDAERGKKIAAHPQVVHALVLATERQRGLPAAAVGECPDERPAVLPDLIKRRIAVPRSNTQRRAGGQDGQTLRVNDRERAQQEA